MGPFINIISAAYIWTFSILCSLLVHLLNQVIQILFITWCRHPYAPTLSSFWASLKLSLLVSASFVGDDGVLSVIGQVQRNIIERVKHISL